MSTVYPVALTFLKGFTGAAPAKPLTLVVLSEMHAMSNVTNDKPEPVRADDDAADLRRIAVTYVDEAFATGRHEGLDSDSLAHAALFAAFRDLVSTYGEDATAVFAETLPGKIKAGAYSVCTRH